MKRPIWFFALTIPIACAAALAMVIGDCGENVMSWLVDTERRLRTPARPDAPTEER